MNNSLKCAYETFDKGNPMTIVLESFPIPNSGPLDISLNISTEINISSADARRKVNAYLLNYLSHLTISEPEPVLVVGERVVWRVGIQHSLPAYGPIGHIGEMDVDVETGELFSLSPKQLEGMKHRAKELAARYPLHTSPAS